jgi:PKHD-type hydroxylase
MILCIGEVLEPSALADLRALLARGTFEDGRETAGWSARLVKHNRQLAAGTVSDEVTARVLEALRTCPMLQIAALPRHFRPPIVSRTEAGMGYGTHIDDALMGQPLARTDLSYTLFLSAPEEYNSGELVLEDTQGDHSFKLPAGHLLLYPSTYLHRVESVTSGARLVAAGWIQSVCRLAAHREVLFDLHRLMTAEFEASGKTAAFDLLSKTRSNLLRLFADV